MAHSSFPLPASVAALLSLSLGVALPGDADAQIDGECVKTECVCPDGTRSGPVDCTTDCADFCSSSSGSSGSSSGSSGSQGGGSWFAPAPTPVLSPEEQARRRAAEARRREELRRAIAEAARIERERIAKAKREYHSSVEARERLEEEGGRLDAEFAALRANLAQAGRGSVPFALAAKDLLAVPGWSHDVRGAANQARCALYSTRLGLAYRAVAMPVGSGASGVAPAPAADFNFLNQQVAAYGASVLFDGRGLPDGCESLEPPAVHAAAIKPPLEHPALALRTAATSPEASPPKLPPVPPEQGPDPAEEAAREASCEEIFALEHQVGELQRGLGQLQRSALGDAAQLDEWAGEVDKAVNASWGRVYDMIAAESLTRIQGMLRAHFRGTKRQAIQAYKNLEANTDPGREADLWKALRRAARQNAQLDQAANVLFPQLQDLSKVIDFEDWARKKPGERIDSIKGVASILQSLLEDRNARHWLKFGRRFAPALKWSVAATESALDAATVLVSWERIKKLDPQTEQYLPQVEKLQAKLKTSTDQLRDKRKTRATACAPRAKKP